jgi:anthranilate phosphoribosyltransferase
MVCKWFANGLLLFVMVCHCSLLFANSFVSVPNNCKQLQTTANKIKKNRMKKILQHLFEHKALSREQAREVLTKITANQYNEAQIAAFITVYLMRAITVEELQGFRDALLELCVPIDFEGVSSIDMCGTGGDGKNTFNISTLASVVIAGAGYKVTKHGNYGVSSICGSSNVLEYLGYRFTNDADKLKKQLNDTNICFLHAPLFHPAMKSVGPIRQLLGVKTFFNMLGPLVNPAQPKQQMVGVFNMELARLYQYIYQQTDKQYAIVHGLDGFDEVSLTDACAVKTPQGEYIVTPEQIGFERVTLQQIDGGETIAEAAKIFRHVLNNEATAPQHNAVVANAALGIRCFKPKSSLTDCVAEANESIVSGKAKKAFENLVQMV